MKKVFQITSAVILMCSIIGAGILPSIVATDSQRNEIQIENQDELQMEKTTSPGYTGHLRVYIVEPVSRWNNYDGEPYHYGFLGFAFNENISIEQESTFQESITWNGEVTESNVLVIAVISNSHQNTGYANPPRRYPFVAYYTDATAAATPGSTGYNTVTTNFTHTVFVEEATATWCPYCPAMANALHTAFETGEYPFYFVAMVDDKNEEAANRLRNEYNIYGFPSAFVDGGYRVIVGGYDNPNTYINLIKASGMRKVPDLNLSVSVTYTGNGGLQIGVNITSNNLPPAKPETPSGESKGGIDIDYNFTTSTTDPNNDTLWYWFEWGDGNNSGWIGPYPSGTIVTANHTWTKKGTYNIKVKAIDTSNIESDWSDPFPIKMPYSYDKPVIQLLDLLSQRFPNAFLFLRQLIGS